MTPKTEELQTKSDSKDDPKPDPKGKLKADAKEDLKPGAKPTSKDDLKSIPMADLQAKLQSSAKGLTQAEAAKRLAQDGPNALKVEKTNAFLKFLGTHSVDDRGSRHPFGGGTALVGLLHHLGASHFERARRVLGRTSGGE